MSDVLRDSSGVLRRRLLTMQLDQALHGFALVAFRPHSPCFSREATERSRTTLGAASE